MWWLILKISVTIATHWRCYKRYFIVLIFSFLQLLVLTCWGINCCDSAPTLSACILSGCYQHEARFGKAIHCHSCKVSHTDTHTHYKTHTQIAIPDTQLHKCNSHYQKFEHQTHRIFLCLNEGTAETQTPYSQSNCAAVQLLCSVHS